MSGLSRLSMLQQCQVLHVVWVCWCIILSQTSGSEYKTIYICRSPQTAPILSLSMEIQQNAGEIPELMEGFVSCQQWNFGPCQFKGNSELFSWKTARSHVQAPDLLPLNKPGLTQFVPCHRKSFRKAATHPAFSSVAALTYQAQKWPGFVFCFQQESSHYICYLSWSKAKG